MVPEINGETTKKSKLIANPNCTTAIGLMALWPLHKLFGLKKVIMSTYQAASGAGQPGMDELQEGTRSVLSGERDVAENKIFAHPLPFNVIPQIDNFQENGYTKEEMKVTWEARKICGLPDDFPLRSVTSFNRPLVYSKFRLVTHFVCPAVCFAVAQRSAFPHTVPIRRPL